MPSNTESEGKIDERKEGPKPLTIQDSLAKEFINRVISNTIVEGNELLLEFVSPRDPLNVVRLACVKAVEIDGFIIPVVTVVKEESTFLKGECPRPELDEAPVVVFRTMADNQPRDVRVPREVKFHTSYGIFVILGLRGQKTT